ncbi:MAG: ATP-dependent helicase [Cyanobacteria bacterium P01_H01_bin.74]
MPLSPLKTNDENLNSPFNSEFIEGPMGAGKTAYLVQKAHALLNNGPASQVLILCSNHTRQQVFIARLLEKQSGAMAQLPVYTFLGFVRNCLFNDWPSVELSIQQVEDRRLSPIRPELSGLEDSEFILRILLARLRHQKNTTSEQPFAEFPGTDAHILKQIIRRLRLRAENGLTRKTMQTRSELLNEQWLPDVTQLENQFDKVSYALRVLDPSKQLEVFHRLLTTDSPLQRELQQQIRHLVVDDVDETIAAQQQFIALLSPTLETVTMAADIDGGSRRGYLNAYPYDWEALKALKPAATTVVLRREDAMADNAARLLNNWKLSDSELERSKPLSDAITCDDTFMTRIEMMDAVVRHCCLQLEQGALPGDLAIAFPKSDFLVIYHLQQKLKLMGIPIQLLSGTQRPSDNPKCQAFLTLIQWANLSTWHCPPSRWDIAGILIELLKLNRVDSSKAPDQNHESDSKLSQALAVENTEALVDQLATAIAHWFETVWARQSDINQASVQKVGNQSAENSDPPASWQTKSEQPPIDPIAPDPFALDPFGNVSPVQDIAPSLTWLQANWPSHQHHHCPEKSSSQYAMTKTQETQETLEAHETRKTHAPDTPTATDGFDSAPLHSDTFCFNDLWVKRYKQLTDWLAMAKNQSFRDQLFGCFKHLIAPFASENDRYSDLSRILNSYTRQAAIFSGLCQTLGETKALQLITGNHNGIDPAPCDQSKAFGFWWLNQVKLGSMADTPDVPDAVRSDALVLGTPQKLIDAEVYRKHYFWLDVSMREWAKSDNAPLYNAWVHSAVWDGSHYAFTDAFQESIIRYRAGHITRTLALLAQTSIDAYASELDELGLPNAGKLRMRLISDADKKEASIPLERASLRADQQPILAYQHGTMAISAVPGSGKTFVNIELLLELISRGVAPGNILVLTFMDSAAKTLLARLKKKLRGHTTELPCISTIHSLAFRILTDADNALALGISPDTLAVMDDIQRDTIIKQVADATMPEGMKKPAEWASAISSAIAYAKTVGITPEAIERSNQYRLQEFLPAYKRYTQALTAEGLLDFTDLIVLAIRLLKENPDCRKRYQEQFTYIIEDEAQDSSWLLQEFIALLGGTAPNLIRTGDTNQSITATFSAGDTALFRDFIQSAGTVIQMQGSARCAPEIISLSNAFMAKAQTLDYLSAAFVPVQMDAIAGMNPDLLYPVDAKVFERDAEETQWIIERIQAIRAAEPDASIAVLLRHNSQVIQLAGTLQQLGIPAISFSEQLHANAVFGFIFATLKVILNPINQDPLYQGSGNKAQAHTPQSNKTQTQWYHQWCLLNDVPPQPDIEDFLNQHSLFYTPPEKLHHQLLRQWHYDFQEFRQLSFGQTINTLIARITDRFCTAVANRSNGYLCALMAHEIVQSMPEGTGLSAIETVAKAFDGYERSWKKSRNFNQVLLQDNALGGVVQLMTLHKSKGQEFDVVFMPAMQSSLFPEALNQVKFDETDRLTLALKALKDPVKTPQGPKNLAEFKKQQEDDHKQAKLEENARLVYVGLTRAKRALFLSAHTQETTRYRKLRPNKPAGLFLALQSLLQPPVNSHQPVAPIPSSL